MVIVMVQELCSHWVIDKSYRCVESDIYIAHDYRIMNVESGWLRVPAINLGITLPKALIEVAR